MIGCVCCGVVIKLTEKNKGNVDSVLCKHCLVKVNENMLPIDGDYLRFESRWDDMATHYRESIVSTFVDRLNLHNNSMVEFHGTDVRFAQITVDVILDQYSDELPYNDDFVEELELQLLDRVSTMEGLEKCSITFRESYCRKFLELAPDEARGVHEIIYEVIHKTRSLGEEFIRKFTEDGVDELVDLYAEYECRSDLNNVE